MLQRWLLVSASVALVAVSGTLIADTGTPVPPGVWTMAITKGLPAETNGWEQLVYAHPLQQSIMLSQYHQRNSEPNESLVGYNFDTNSWDIIDMGGNFHTENIPEGGESQGYFDFNPNNNTLVYHCCTTGSNQSENANHTWWYDLLGQSGRDKHTSPKPPFSALQPGGAFDPAHNKFVFHGGDSFVGTWTYDPVANLWQKMSPGGTLPNPSLILAGLAYSTAEQKIYLFGGYAAGYTNDLYIYDLSTNTWTLVSPANGVKPAGRFRHGFAYDSRNNIFLLNGGQNGSGVLGDTWVFDPSTNAWSQVNSPTSPPTASGAVFARLTYDSDHNVFVLAAKGTGGYFGGNWTAYAIQTWLFRYAGPGPNAGTVSTTAQASPGGVNRNPSSWGKDPALASSGNSLYLAWSETASPFDSSNAAWPHIYVSQYSGANWTAMGSSSSINIDLDEAHAPSMAVIANAPWVSWYESSNTGQTAQVTAKSWNGANWQGITVGKTGSSAYQGRSQLLDFGGAPNIAYLEVDKGTFPQRTLLYVKTWNGTSWVLRGTGPLNHVQTAGGTADSVSMATDGVNPYVAWTEYVHNGGSNIGDIDTNPQVYVATWNGTQWVYIGSSLNVNTSNWAYDASIAFAGGQPYVAWTERTPTGNAQLYVKTWNGTAWVLVGSGTLNHTPDAGWAYHPSLVAGGSNLYLGWVEQSALGQKAQVYVSRYAAGAWTPLGTSLNIDTTQGSAQRVSLAVYNGQPVAAWGEVNLAALRQVYVKQWTGSAWTQLSAPNIPDVSSPTTPTGVSATAVSKNQINLSWSPSTDLVGVTGYKVYRGGSLVATVTSAFNYADTGLLPFTPYSYTVVAFDAAGNMSNTSATASATTLADPAANLSAVILSPTTIVGGLSTTANTVRLSGPAPSGNATVTLSSNDSHVTTPASVTIPAGSGVSAPFTISTTAVATNLTVTISAVYNGVTQTATLTVTPAALSTLTLSPSSVTGSVSTTNNTVALNGAAPAGGATVTLTSSDPGVTVPGSVTIPAGSTTSAAFTIATSPVAASTNVTISATYNGVTKTATLTVTPVALSALTLSPSSIAGGGSTTTNTITLSGPAPPGGISVMVSSSDPGVTVPASVMVPGGSTTSAGFTIATSAVASSTTVTISAVLNGVTKTAALTVTPVVLSGLTLSPMSVVGGVAAASNNTVALNGPAQGSGAVVMLSSSDPGVTVPASITVPAGQATSPAFAITTTSVPASMTVTISASYNGVTKTATLTVNPVSLSALTLSPATISGGSSTTGNVVTLNGPAPSGGTVVTLTSSDPSAVPPSSITVPAGSTTSAAFTITTSRVAATVNAIISATSNGVTKTGGLKITPVTLFSLTLSPSSVAGGGSTTANTVTLNAPAPDGGALVTLTSSDPSATVPASVTVPAGASISPAFTISTTAVPGGASVTISAAYNGVTKTGILTITSVSLSSLTLSPSSIGGGGSTTANKVTLTGPAPSGGATVTLTSSDPSVTVPASITVPAGATSSAAFTISTTSVATSSTVTISATYMGTTKTATLTVNAIALSAITVSPISVAGGLSANNNSVTLSGPAPSGGALVMLASSDPSATVPASVTVAAGATTSSTFSITTSQVAVSTAVTISASYGGVTKTNTLTVLPPAITVVSLSPSTVSGGASTSANKVTISGPAPAGGLLINLASSDPAASVPASVTVPAGSTVSALFTVTTTAVSANTSVTISATYNGTGKSALLTIVPLAISAVSLSPTSVVGGVAVNGNNKITLNGPAPSGGITVLLSSSDPGVTVPASVTVSPGTTTSATFSITTSPVSASTAVIISAAYNGSTQTATLAVLPATVSLVTLSPASVVGGGASTANVVHLNGPAPAGGAVVALASTDPHATVPSSVTVAAGATVSPTFIINTSAVNANISATISASYQNVTKTAVLTVIPVGISSIILSPVTAVGGVAGPANNRITLNAAAVSDITVSIASSDPSVIVPASVTIPAGASVSPTFSITTSPVAVSTAVTISAAYNGITKTATFTVIPPTVSSVTLSPSSVVGGGSTASNTVKLNGPAPAGGVAVTLASSDPHAMVPSSVTVSAGATISPQFAISSTAVSTNTTVTITATYNGVSKTASLTLLPATASALRRFPGSLAARFGSNAFPGLETAGRKDSKGEFCPDDAHGRCKGFGNSQCQTSLTNKDEAGRLSSHGEADQWNYFSYVKGESAG